MLDMLITLLKAHFIFYGLGILASLLVYTGYRLIKVTPSKQE